MAEIALCMGLADSWEHGIARGVVRYARMRPAWRLYGYGWMFRPLESLEHWDGDGIIARVESPRDAQRIASLGLPVVDVAGAYPLSGFHQVTNDELETGRRAAGYLGSCGFRRFAYAGVRGVLWSGERKRGFLDALGLEPRALPCYEESLPWWEGRAPGRLAGWLRSLEPPVGIFACNDTAGLKLTEYCRRAGLRVPEDVAILGVDDEDILCELALPSLSSISLDLEGIGYRAAAALEELLRSPRKAPASRATVRVPPGQTVERESTRVYTCQDPLVEKAVRYIRLSTPRPISVGDVLTGLPVSRRSLEIRFRRVTGRSIRAEIQRVRLERARTLLRSTDARVADIARECGYRTPQRFHQVFRACEGQSPARYRRASRATPPRGSR